MLSSLLKVGMLLNGVLARLEHLQRDIEQGLLYHSLNESLYRNEKDKRPNDYEKHLAGSVEPQIKEINKMINGTNRIAKVLNLDVVVPKLEHKNLKVIINGRVLVFAKSQKEEYAQDQIFRLKLQNYFKPVRDSINNLIERSDESKNRKDLNKLDKRYKDEMYTACSLLSIGEFKISVFWSGRAVEWAINDYYRSLMKHKKIKIISLKKMKFENKINRLKSDKFINESLAHLLNIQRIDRNNSGHPIRSRFTYESSQLTISSAISAIIKLQDKIKKLERTSKKGN